MDESTAKLGYEKCFDEMGCAHAWLMERTPLHSLV